jgi:site-specific DNA recombinase
MAKRKGLGAESPATCWFRYYKQRVREQKALIEKAELTKERLLLVTSVTGERIRDKVAASKKKGMWMGGIVPLGYDHQDKQLHVNRKEAEQVRHIFDHHLRLRSVFDRYDYLKANGYRSEQRVRTDGSSGGGSVLSRGTLYHLLSNPVYIGKTRHGGKLYDGRHDAIVDQKIWQQAAELLASNRVTRRTSHNVASGRILLGLLFDESGNRFTPTHSSKKGRRYAYYTLTPTDECTPAVVQRLPAVELEQLVVSRIRDLLSKPIDLAANFSALSVRDTRLLVAAGRHRAEQLTDITSSDSARLLRNILMRLVLSEAKILIEISVSALKTALLEQHGDSFEQGGHDNIIHLECPLLIRRRGSEVKLMLENGEPTEPKPIPSLARAVALSRHWADEIVDGKFSNLDEVARSASLNRRYARRILQCAALSPALTETILEGRQPVELSVDRLTRNLPLSWKEQRL